tara:strand:- start:2936 stop:3328 length:393 start_codon:yes stop_codon:yes gene_type:complete
MKTQSFKPLFYLSAIASLVYVVHKLVFFFLAITTIDFYYSLEKLYLFFYVLSLIVFLILLKVKEKSFDNVGMSFLLSTSVKMIFCFILLKPILNSAAEKNTLEKMNFFVVFILFLAIETILTIRILNEKQ